MPIAKKAIPQDFLNQMKSNLTKENTEESVTQEASVTQTSIPEKKEEKYADVMNVRLSKGRRNEIKTFCASCGISVTQFIESSFEFLEEEVEAGRIAISKGGIKRIEG